MRPASGRCASGSTGCPPTVYGERAANPDSGRPSATAAPVTFGSSRSLAITRSKKSTCCAGVRYRSRGTLTNAAATPAGSNPGSVRWSFTKLPRRSPDPTSSTTASATSAIVSAARNRPARAPDDPRALSLSASTSCGRDACRPGTSPTSAALASVTATVNHTRAPVQRHRGIRRQLRAEERLQRRERADRERHAEDPGDEGKDQALGEELPDDAGAAGAERLPDRDLLLARGQPSEKQRRHVGARDEQHEGDRAEQRVERRLEAGDQARDVRLRQAGVLGVEPRGEPLLVAAADRRQLGRGLFQRDVGFQARDRPGVAGADLDLRRRQAAGLEHARREHLHLRVGRAHPRRRDADDLPRHAVQRDRAADEIRAAAEPRLPQLVADDADRRAVRHVLLRREVAAERRTDAERRQERVAHAQAVQLFGIAVAGEREAVERRDADRRERRGVVAQLLVTRPRHRRRRRRQLRVPSTGSRRATRGLRW